ncbi:O-antigen ligase family protein [Candidatus Uhrbacteria bacterium]|nr:O-antigen ligase family protein [Candidatus Uhrbacteria bacterium]
MTFILRAFSFSAAALAFFLPLGTVVIVRGAESQYERALFAATDVILIAVSILGALYWIRSPKRDAALNKTAGYLAVFLAAATLSLFAIPEITLANLAVYTRLLVASWAAFCIAVLPCEKKTTLSALVIAGVLQAGYGIAQFAFQHIGPIPLLGVAEHSPLNLGDAVVQTSQMRFLRAYGSFAHPNILGAFLGVCFLVALFLTQAARGTIHRAALIASTLILSAGILLSFSRGAWFSLVAALVASSFAGRWYARRAQPQSETSYGSLRVLVFGVLAVCAIFVFSFSDILLSRFGIALDARLETRSVEERLAYADEAFSLIRNHPFGLGIGNYVPYLIQRDRTEGSILPFYEYQPVHTHVLLVFAELGIIGFAVFLAFLFSIIVVIKRRSAALVYSIPIFRLICGVGVFVLVSGLFDHAYWTIPSAVALWWFSIGIALRTHSI